MWSKLAFAAALSVAVVDGANWNPKSVYNAINTDTANDMQTYDKCNASDDTAFVKPEDRYCLNGPPNADYVIDCNHYTDKGAVWLSAGPENKALPKGSYIFIVLATGGQSGNVMSNASHPWYLSTDDWKNRLFNVSDDVGTISYPYLGVSTLSCAHTHDTLYPPPSGTRGAVRLMPYKDSPKNDGYVMAVCQFQTAPDLSGGHPRIDPDDCGYDVFHIDARPTTTFAPVALAWDVHPKLTTTYQGHWDVAKYVGTTGDCDGWKTGTASEVSAVVPGGVITGAVMYKADFAYRTSFASRVLDATVKVANPVANPAKVYVYTKLTVPLPATYHNCTVTLQGTPATTLALNDEWKIAGFPLDAGKTATLAIQCAYESDPVYQQVKVEVHEQSPRATGALPSLSEDYTSSTATNNGCAWARDLDNAVPSNLQQWKLCGNHGDITDAAGTTPVALCSAGGSLPCTTGWSDTNGVATIKYLPQARIVAPTVVGAEAAITYSNSISLYDSQTGGTSLADPKQADLEVHLVSAMELLNL